MDHLSHTRRHLGELGVMSEQTQRAEEKILQRARAMLSDLEGRLQELRAPALAGDEEASRKYREAIEERGRLEIVVSQAQKNLS